MLVPAVVAGCLIVAVALALAATAQAGFVPALGSPFGTGTPTAAIDVADLNGDGIADVASGGPASGTIAVRLGDGSGWIGRVRALGVPGPVLALAGGDLNGDGLRDYATIAPGEPRRLLVHTAAAGGGYAQATALADAGDATDVEIANVDGGGAPELVVADAGGAVTVVRAVGGAFVAGDPIPTGAAGAVARIALGHLDGDGRLDLVATDGGGAPAVVALRGDGGGGFEPLGRRAAGLAHAPTAVATGDMNGDGRTDVVTGSAGGMLAVLHGDGAGGLTAAPGSPFGTGATAVVDDAIAADMNGDGQLDAVAANRTGSVSILLSSDTGLLAADPPAIDFGALPAGSPPQARAITLRAVRGRVRITRHDVYGSAGFARADGDCVGRTLLLGQACTLSVAFTPPRRAREEQSLLSVDANAAAVVVPLVGAARPPLVDSARVRPRRALPGRRLTLRYDSSEEARVSIRLERASVGRRAGRRRARGAASPACLPPRRGNLRRRRCRIWEPLRAYSPRRAFAGRNVVRFRARARGRRLDPGLYRLSLTAVDAFRNRSEEAYAAFRVREPRRRRGAPGR